MSKIALVSYHFYHNYGTCLQAYALWHKLNKMGVDCEYLNFGQCNEKKSIVQTVKRHLRLLKHFKYKKSIDSNYRSFVRFRKKHVHETREYTSEELYKIAFAYDKFILGSDQTLNPDCVNEALYKRMLLTFVKKKKKYTFASSLGKYNLSDDEIESLKELQDFQCISVRERNTQQVLSLLLEKDVKFVLDPTFLLTKQEWLQLANPDYSVKKSRYVFCYLLGSNERIVLFAKKIAQEKKLDLILYTIYPKFYHYSDGLLENCGPFEFVKTIANAQYVVTDSFHGSILSINCHVNFYAFYKRAGGLYQGDNGRLFDFLRLLDLQNRLLDDTTLDLLQDVDYDAVEKKLEPMKRTTMEYLNHIVSV